MGKLTVAYNYNSIITSTFKIKSFRFHISYTVAAVFEVALQYSPRCNIARKQADILAIEPALQYNPQIYIILLLILMYPSF